MANDFAVFLEILLNASIVSGILVIILGFIFSLAMIVIFTKTGELIYLAIGIIIMIISAIEFYYQFFKKESFWTKNN